MRVKRYVISNESDGYGVELREVMDFEQPDDDQEQYAVMLVLTGDYPSEEDDRTVLLTRRSAVGLVVDLRDFLDLDGRES